jgi:hypothetical protein
MSARRCASATRRPAPRARYLERYSQRSDARYHARYYESAATPPVRGTEHGVRVAVPRRRAAVPRTAPTGTTNSRGVQCRSLHGRRVSSPGTRGAGRASGRNTALAHAFEPCPRCRVRPADPAPTTAEIAERASSAEGSSINATSDRPTARTHRPFAAVPRTRKGHHELVGQVPQPVPRTRPPRATHPCGSLSGPARRRCIARSERAANPGSTIPGSEQSTRNA